MFQDGIAALSVLGGHVDAAYPLCPVIIEDSTHTDTNLNLNLYLNHSLNLSTRLGSNFGVLAKILENDTVEAVISPVGVGIGAEQKGTSIQASWDKVRALSRCPLEGLKISNKLLESVLVLTHRVVLGPPLPFSALEPEPKVESKTENTTGDDIPGVTPESLQDDGSTVHEAACTLGSVFGAGDGGDDTMFGVNPMNDGESEGDGEKDDERREIKSSQHGKNDKREKRPDKKDKKEKDREREREQRTIEKKPDKKDSKKERKRDLKTDRRDDRKDDKEEKEQREEKERREKELEKERARGAEQTQQDPLMQLVHFLTLTASKALASLSSVLPAADQVLEIVSSTGENTHTHAHTHTVHAKFDGHA
jgi:hypothetical protein